MNKNLNYRAILCCMLLLMSSNTLMRAQIAEYPYLQQPTRSFNTVLADSLEERAWRTAAQNPDSGLRLLTKLYYDFSLANYTKGMANALLSMGMTHTAIKKDPAKGIIYFRKGFLVYDRIEDKNKEWMKNWITSWYNNMGAAFLLQDVPDSAVYYYEKALHQSLDPKNKQTIDLGNTYINLSTMLIELKQNEKARYYLRKAASTTQTKNALVWIYLNMALSYQDEARFDSVLHYLKQVDKLAIPLKEQHNMYYTLYGIYYEHQGKVKSAIEHFQQAVITSKGSRHETNSLGNLGATYLSDKNYPQAKKYLELALKEGKEKKAQKSLMKMLYINLANLYDSLHDYRKAYHYRTLAYTIADSISRVERNKVIHQIETRYRTAEKDRNIAAQAQNIAEKQVELFSVRQKLNQKNFWMLAVSGGSLLLVFLFILMYQKQRLKLQRAKTDQQRQQIAQLSAVLDGEEKERARIGRQLHDDVMVEISVAKINLATLPDEFPQIKTSTTFDRIEHQLEKAGIKVRQTAHNLMPDALLTEGLLYAIGYFCSGIGKSTNIDINFHHFGDLPELSTETEVNLYRIVQELVQNIVKHAAASEALVQLYSRDKVISLTVDDNGRGIADLQKAEEGMGIKSIRSRLKLMGGEMDIRSACPRGTAVHIEIEAIS